MLGLPLVTETAIDALSFAQMENCREETAYISTAGNPSNEQIEQLLSAIVRHSIGRVVLAHDNDKGGDDQAEKIRERLQDIYSGEIVRRASENAKDWNEELQDIRKVTTQDDDDEYHSPGM